MDYDAIEANCKKNIIYIIIIFIKQVSFSILLFTSANEANLFVEVFATAYIEC